MSHVNIKLWYNFNPFRGKKQPTVNANNYNYKIGEFFLDSKRDLYELKDIVEITSLLREKSPKQVFALLFNSKNRKIKRVLYVDFDSNFSKVESNLPEQVNFFENCFSLDIEDPL